MSTLESVKNRLIDRILTSKNEKLLEAVENIFASTQKEEVIKLKSEQIEMLMMSEEDIQYGRVIAESDLDKMDNQ
jgi:predicted CopG family antitoxin